MTNPIHSIALPSRPQPDTLIAITLLKHFGKNHFPGIEAAKFLILQRVEPFSEEKYLQQGILLIDVGNGRFDHHNKLNKTTASHLIAEYLGILHNSAISNLLNYAQRDDFFGKGTISNDPIDRAFGLSGLIHSLNKQYPQDPDKVAQTIFPLLQAHLLAEIEKNETLPREFQEKKQNGETIEFLVKQYRKKLKVIMLKADNPGMIGYLRSQGGGAYDVVLQQTSTGHINLLTRPLKRIDLRMLAAVIRQKELEKRGENIQDMFYLTCPAQIKEVPEWYYDRATNSVQNGGINPQQIEPTKIQWDEWNEILEKGLIGLPRREN